MSATANVRAARNGAALTDLLRSELASAIADASTAKASLQRARATARRSEDFVDAAHERQARADAAVRSALDRRADALASAAASGSAPTEDRTVSAARSKAQDAADELEAAQAALARAQAELPELEQAERATNARVGAAANAVACSDTRRLVSEADALMDELIRRRVVLRYMVHELGLSGAAREAASTTLLRHELPGTFGSVAFTDWETHAATAPWREARDRLSEDAAAPLPAS